MHAILHWHGGVHAGSKNCQQYPEKTGVKKSTLLTLGLFVAAVLALGGTARGDEVGTLTLSNCGGGDSGCPAATYNFSITSTSATLSITIDGAVNSKNDQLTAVDLGFTSSGGVTGPVTLDSSSEGYGSWFTTTSSLSNSGCGGKNEGAFVCTSGPGIDIAQGDTYTWVWDFTGISGSLDSVDGVHIGANYGPHNGLIVSETGATAGPMTPTPEPSTGVLALLGFGLVGVSLAFRRSRG